MSGDCSSTLSKSAIAAWSGETLIGIAIAVGRPGLFAAAGTAVTTW